ncbi:MAG: DNA-binding response regulator [Calditrichaeota bacterium]|nr:MAG: DNA-binding response regulator [Calditrichota bacterium]
MSSVNQILIIEDDVNIADVIEIHLNDMGYELDRAEDGVSGLERALSREYRLIILDLMLPGMEGMEVCKRIRSQNPYIPILILTARGEELDKVLGLEFGADDYVTKPFGIREFLARVKAILRRVEVDKEVGIAREIKEPLQFGNLIVDLHKRKVMVQGKLVELTAKEFDLLALFVSNPGRVYSRQELLDIVWGYHYNGYDHTVNSHINRLRNKIEADPANPQYLKTLWGVGYRFSEKEELE